MRKLKTIYTGTIDSDFVSAKDFKRLYEVHLKALNKIEVMEVSANNAWDEWCRLSASSEESQAYIEQVISDNIGLTEQNKQLTNEVAALKQALAELQQAMENGKFN